MPSAPGGEVLPKINRKVSSVSTQRFLASEFSCRTRFGALRTRRIRNSKCKLIDQEKNTVSAILVRMHHLESDDSAAFSENLSLETPFCAYVLFVNPGRGCGAIPKNARPRFCASHFIPRRAAFFSSFRGGFRSNYCIFYEIESLRAHSSITTI